MTLLDRLCGKCLQLRTWPFDFVFRRRAGGKRAPTSWCKPCKRADTREWKRRNPERSRELDRRAYDRYMAKPENRARANRRNREYMRERRKDPAFRRQQSEEASYYARQRAERAGRAFIPRPRIAPQLPAGPSVIEVLADLVERKPLGVTLAQRYAHAEARVGACPIESGFLLRLVDHECPHGRLASDRTPACGCWPEEAPTTSSSAA